PDGQRQTAFSEDYHPARLNVSGDRAERDTGFFELGYGEIFAHIIFRALAVVKPQFRDRHAAKIIPTYRQRQSLDLVRRKPGRVRAADQRTDARSGDQIDRDIMLLQFAQNADMRAPASHPAAERKTNHRIFLTVSFHTHLSFLNRNAMRQSIHRAHFSRRRAPPRSNNASSQFYRDPIRIKLKILATRLKLDRT